MALRPPTPALGVRVPKGAASKCSALGASRQGSRCFKSAAPQGAGSPGGAAFQDATRSEELQSPREIQVFNSHTILRLINWISLRGLQLPRPICIPEGGAPWTRCTLGRCAPKLSAPLGLRHQTLALAGCAPKPLQWLRHLISVFHRLNCNQVPTPLRSFGITASKYRGLEPQPPRFMVFEERGSSRCRESRLQRKSKFYILGVV